MTVLAPVFASPPYLFQGILEQLDPEVVGLGALQGVELRRKLLEAFFSFAFLCARLRLGLLVTRSTAPRELR